MAEVSGLRSEPYLVGGNLLNEQERILEAKERHEAAKKRAAERVQDGTAKPRGEYHIEGGGAWIPAHHSDNIADERNTRGGGFVPPGSTGEGNAHVHGSGLGVDY